jgi:hypothetical protein
MNDIIKNDNFGFIIVRHVNSEKTNKYWIEAYSLIRKYYNNKIVIIDDNSDYNFVNYNSEYIDIINCEFIKSEYNCRGEILGYYYYQKWHSNGFLFLNLFIISSQFYFFLLNQDYLF